MMSAVAPTAMASTLIQAIILTALVVFLDLKYRQANKRGNPPARDGEF